VYFRNTISHLRITFNDFPGSINRTNGYDSQFRKLIGHVHEELHSLRQFSFFDRWNLMKIFENPATICCSHEFSKILHG